MIDREHALPISKQTKVLRISRGSVYYLPRPVSASDLEVMRRLDRLHLEHPFAGSRMLHGLLLAEGYKIGRRHVKTLMKRMGIEALYRRPRTTKSAPGHTIYPYLLRGMEVTRPNEVWAMDITYIPMARGFSNPAGPPGEGVRRCWAGFAEPDAGMKTFGAVSGSRRKSADERY